MTDYSIFPKINATLNGCSGLLLVTGRLLIARGKMAAHRVVMLTAFATSSLFLASYSLLPLSRGFVHFRGTGWTRPLYFTILFSYTTLVVVIGPRCRYAYPRASNLTGIN
jgi:putative membrane protein